MLQALNSKKLTLVMLAAALIAVVITGCAPSASAANPSQAGGSVPTNTISVSGLGEAFGQPDQATVMLGINISNANVGDAVAQSNEVMDSIIAALVEAGVAREDIQTVNFSVWPEDRYDPTGMPTGERTFRVDSTVQVKVRDMAKVGAVIDAGLGAGANSVQGLNFSIADQDALESEARTKALEDAREKAQQIAAAMGVELGDPIIVSETDGGGYLPYYGIEASAGRGAGGAGDVAISPGQQAVNVQLYVTFGIK